MGVRYFQGLRGELYSNNNSPLKWWAAAVKVGILLEIVSHSQGQTFLEVWRKYLQANR